MKLLTKEIIEKLKKYPLGSQDGKNVKDVIVKFFHPFGGRWYVTEAEEQNDGDWLFFGYVELIENEWGYFSLSELESIKPHGMGIERDKYLHDFKIDFNKSLSLPSGRSIEYA